MKVNVEIIASTTLNDGRYFIAPNGQCCAIGCWLKACGFEIITQPDLYQHKYLKLNEYDTPAKYQEYLKNNFDKAIYDLNELEHALMMNNAPRTEIKAALIKLAEKNNEISI